MSFIADIEPIYNSIGKTYDTTRRADPGIVQKIIQFLCKESSKHYLDIGCGSGNYTSALSKLGLSIDGVDIYRWCGKTGKTGAIPKIPESGK